MLDFVQTFIAHTTEFNLLNNYTLDEQNKPWFLKMPKCYKSIFKNKYCRGCTEPCRSGGVLRGCEVSLSPRETMRTELTSQLVCLPTPCAFTSPISLCMWWHKYGPGTSNIHVYFVPLPKIHNPSRALLILKSSKITHFPSFSDKAIGDKWWVCVCMCVGGGGRQSLA